MIKRRMQRGVPEMRMSFNSKEKGCPYLKNCSNKVPQMFFKQICNSEAYNNCRHYASKAGELQKPLFWLQKLAVEESIRNSSYRKT
jgi:hypothetical protein